MNTHLISTPQRSSGLVNLRPPWILPWICLIVFTSLIAVSSQSFWIDELTTVHFAGQPSVRAMWEELTRLRWPEIQAPLYMAYMWGWLKVFGNGEWTVRIAGTLIYILGACVFVSSWRSRMQRAFACLTVSLSPFVWFYLNEARLYSIQLGLALVIVSCLIKIKRIEQQDGSVPRRWFALFCLSSVLLAAVNVLGMIWASSAFLILPVLFPIRTILKLVRRDLWIVSGTCVMLGLCATYYVWTRSMGISPTLVGRTDWRSCCFIFYELLGFNGVGPGRLALREGGLPTLKPWLPLLLLFGAVLCLVLLGAISQLRERWRLWDLTAASMALGFPAGFILATGLSTNFRVLGRHFAPLGGVVLLLLAMGMQRLWSNWGSTGRGVCLLAVCLSAFSCVAQRFSPRHAKDDYRGAAVIAKSCLEQGLSVWWNADEFGADTYGVPASRESFVPGKAWLCFPTLGFHPVDKADVVIISSKHDVYDPTGELQAFVSTEHYHRTRKLTAFDIFNRK